MLHRPSRVALVALMALTALGACDSHPRSAMAPATDPDLAALPPFPAAPLPPPPRLAATLSATSPTAPLALLRAEVLTPPTDGAGPTVALHFSRDAKSLLGDTPPLALAPSSPYTLSWASPRTLHVALSAPLPPATRLGVVVGEGAARFETSVDWRPLTATSSRYRSWAPEQRQVLEPTELIELAFSDPVSPADLLAHIGFVGADEVPGFAANAPLPAMTPVPWELLVEVEGRYREATAPGTRFHIRPTEGFRTGRVYRAEIRPTLKGAGGLPIAGQPPRFVLTGPPPFDVASVSCGWGHCTPGSSISIEFTRRLSEDPATARCITIDPTLPTRDVDVSWTTIRLTPRVRRVPTRLKVTATTECRSLDGTRLPAPRTFEVEIEAPDPSVDLIDVHGVARPTDAETLATLPVRARGTRRLVVREAPVGRGDEALRQALTFDLSPWKAVDTSSLAFGEPSPVPTPGTLTGDRLVEVPLASVVPGRPGWVFVGLRPEGHPGHGGDASERVALLQVTDLALTAKSGARDTTVWVTALEDGTPVAGATVQVFNRAGAPLGSRQTDADGVVNLPIPGPPAYGDAGPDAARFAVASLGDDRAFIDLESWSTRLSTWRFDIPTEWEEVAERPVGLIFTERGIYRPGDVVHVKGHVRTDQGGAHGSAAGRTALVTVTDPLGQEAYRADVELGPHGDFHLDHTTAAGSATGTWHIALTLVAEAGAGALPGTPALQGAFRVEAFRAPTFETTLPELEVSRTEVRAKVGGRYFFGAPMAGATARWWVHRRPATFSPASWPGFSFGLDPWLDDVENVDESSSRILASGNVTLDASGEALVETPIDVSVGDGEAADRSWHVELEVEVTDADAQVSATRRRSRVDPADLHVGVRVQDSFGAIGTPVTVEVLAVDAEGRALAGRPLALELVRRSWTSRIEKNAAGLETWRSERVEAIVETHALISGEAPVTVSLTPAQAGTHLVRVAGQDESGRRTRTTTAVWVSGRDASWASSNDGTFPLIAARPAWSPGEMARFIAQSPFEKASALVTVETSKVLWQKRLSLTGRAPLIEVPVDAAMAPNAFVSVTLVGQDSAGKAGGTATGAPVAFGYARLDVSTDAQRLAVSVTPDAPHRAPGETATATIRVVDASGRPVRGTATFMAVDESVLALTGFATPDVHKAVFRARSLGLRTGDTRTLVLARRVFEDEDMKSDWGGGGESGVPTRYRSEFAATAAWMPAVPIGDDGLAEVSFTLPDNLTAFRLMAVVASDDGRFGSGDKRMEVKKPLLVRPGLPRFATAGDTVEVKALVQALTADAEGEVEVRASVSGPATLIGDARASIHLKGHGAHAVPFRLKALSAGTATIAFSVHHEGAARSGPTIDDGVEIQLPIVHPAPARHEVATGVLNGQSTGTHHTAFRLELPEGADPNLGELSIDIQNSRLGALLPALGYLVQYPYGCAEQTTSATMPLLSLQRMKAATTALRIDESAITERIQAGVDRLFSMQTPSGGLGYWPGTEEPHLFASTWASLALLEASTTPGVRVPPARLERLLAWLGVVMQGSGTARPGHVSESDAARPFAAWVLARAGVADPATLTSIFEHRADLPVFAKALLGLAIHESRRPEGAGQVKVLLAELRARVDDNAAHALVREENPGAWQYTMSSDIRSTALLAMLLRASSPDDPLLARLEAGLIANQRNGRWNNTQDNAFALLALSERIAADLGQDSPWRAEVHLGDEVILEATMPGDALGSARVVIPMERLVKANGRALSFVRQGGPGHLHYAMSLRHFPVEPSLEPSDRGYAVTRAYVYAEGDRAGQPVDDALRVGDLVNVELTVTTDAPGLYVAVEDPLPAAFEPVLLGAANARAFDDQDGSDPWARPIFNHSDTLDDRVLLFADAMPAGVHRHRYLVRATSAGRFKAAAPAAHEMYSPWVGGEGSTTTVTVAPGS